MSKIVWDKTGERFYETGVQNGVLYVRDAAGLYPLGVPWNGLISVTESPSGAEATPQYADNIKYLNMVSAEEFAATVEAYTYPDEFAACDGSAEVAPGVYIGQQSRRTFGLAYKSVVGNDVDGNDLGYKLHLIYGALAAPSEKAYATINDTPEAITFSWEISTTPVAVAGFKPTASLTIDSTKVSADNLAVLEDIMYGTDEADARLPLPDEVAAIFAGAAPSPITLVSSLPDDDADSVTIDANVVLTFNNKIKKESVIVTADDGTIVPGVKSWDAEGKVLTFNPATNLDASTVYIVTVGGVEDIYNQALSPVVINFITSA
jgi:hypothetical protein